MLALLLLVAQVPADVPTRYVAVSVANLRDTPDPSGKLRLKVPISAQLIVVETKDTWSRVVAGRCQGWLLSEMLGDNPPSLTDLNNAAMKAKDKERQTLLERAAALSPWDVGTLSALVTTLQATKDKSLQATKDGLAIAQIASEHDSGRNPSPGMGRAGVIVADKVTSREGTRRYNTGDVVRVLATKDKWVQLGLREGSTWVEAKNVFESDRLVEFLQSTAPVMEDPEESLPKGKDFGTVAFFQRASRNPNPRARQSAAERLPFYIKDGKQMLDAVAPLTRDFDIQVREAATQALRDMLNSTDDGVKKLTAARLRELLEKLPPNIGTYEQSSLTQIASIVGLGEDATIKALLASRGLRCP